MFMIVGDINNQILYDNDLDIIKQLAQCPIVTSIFPREVTSTLWMGLFG